jgi:hypothetical protein
MTSLATPGFFLFLQAKEVPAMLGFSGYLEQTTSCRVDAVV